MARTAATRPADGKPPTGHPAGPDEAWTPGEIALIEAAERLMALNGVLGVSLRQVNQASGHRNIAAAHYHFGSREGLCRAIHRYRNAAIDARRADLIARATSQPSPPDLRTWMEAFVAPLAAQLLPQPGGNHYLRFLAQYHLSAMDIQPLGESSPAALRAVLGMRDLLAYLPERIVAIRLRDLLHNAVASLANVEHLVNEGRLDASGVALLTGNLVDGLTAALSAPISAATLAALRSVEESGESAVHDL